MYNWPAMDVTNFPNSHLSDQQRLRFRSWLQHQFNRRRLKNPRYSLRAFASALNMDPSSISQMLAGKRRPSTKVMITICRRLDAGPRDMRLMGVRSGDSPEVDSYQLSLDVFSVISDWYHYAILELTFVSGFRSDPKWIAAQLGISIQQTKVALERLLRLGLIKKEKGTLIKTHQLISNHTGINTSEARKNLQRQIIEKAREAIDGVSQEAKDITSMTMAVDPRYLDQARDLIKNFRRELCTLLEQGEPSQVFNLGVQLYPVSKSTEKKL